jgi:predicted enzyme related to lactoylglutathione lyase
MNSGRFIWQELVTDDLAISREFYAELLGWEIRQAADSTAAYEVISVDGSPIGAMHTCDGSGAPAHWLPFIQAADIETVCTRAVSRGGDVIRAQYEHPDFGTGALLADLDGALFVAVDASGGPHAATDMVAWHAIGGRNARQTANFYAEVLDFDVMAHPFTNPAEGFLALCSGGLLAASVFGHNGAVPSTWFHYFSVADLEVSRSMATFLGGKCCTPVMTIAGIGRMAGIIDPTGASFFLAEQELGGVMQQRSAADMVVARS